MKKVIVFGSINMDLVVSVADFPKTGETILSKQHQWFPGGKGANQVVAVRRLGGEVSMVGKIGDDYLAQSAVNVLHKENINTCLLKTVKGVSTGLAIIQVDTQGQNTIVVSPGANGIWPESAEDIDSMLNECDLAVLQLEIPVAVAGKIMQRAKMKGVYTVLNAAPASIDVIPFLPEVDLLIVNETETAILSGEKNISAANINQAISRLTKLGSREIIVTLGENGCVVFTGGNYHALSSYRVKAVDSTAAGDTFVGAVVARLCEGDNILEASRWAVAAGALTVTRLGAQASIPTKKEVDEFLRNGVLGLC